MLDWITGKRVRISLSLSPASLEALDAIADHTSLTRAEIIEQITAGKLALVSETAETRFTVTPEGVSQSPQAPGGEKPATAAADSQASIATTIKAAPEAVPEAAQPIAATPPAIPPAEPMPADPLPSVAQPKQPTPASPPSAIPPAEPMPADPLPSVAQPEQPTLASPPSVAAARIRANPPEPCKAEPGDLPPTLGEDTIKALHHQVTVLTQQLTDLQAALLKQRQAQSAQTTAYEALSQTATQQQQRITELEDQITQLSGVAAIGQSRLNRWRSQGYSR